MISKWGEVNTVKIFLIPIRSMIGVEVTVNISSELEFHSKHWNN